MTGNCHPKCDTAENIKHGLGKKGVKVSGIEVDNENNGNNET